MSKSTYNLSLIVKTEGKKKLTQSKSILKFNWVIEQTFGRNKITFFLLIMKVGVNFFLTESFMKRLNDLFFLLLLLLFC